jgi:hypothetical protein
MKIQVRFNTKDPEGQMCWRVLIDGVEHLASRVVFFNVRVQTIRDWIEDVGWKHHMTCEARKFSWNDTEFHVIG